MCQKMALRCQTRLTKVAVNYASMYPRDCSVSISPVKYSFGSQLKCLWHLRTEEGAVAVEARLSCSLKDCFLYAARQSQT